MAKSKRGIVLTHLQKQENFMLAWILLRQEEHQFMHLILFVLVKLLEEDYLGDQGVIYELANSGFNLYAAQVNGAAGGFEHS